MEWPERFRYVVVEGPIGVGKTSLARRLATEIDSELLLEDPGSNPFLPQFYESPDRHALATQLFFLFQRIDQVRALRQGDFFRGVTTADFFFAKDPLFAQLTLGDEEFALYRKIHDHLAPQAPVPDLVIYLQASVDTLLDRVRRRGVPSESGIPEDYLRALSDSYTRYFYNYDESALLIVNSERLNFVDVPDHFDLLVERVKTIRGGREFFNKA